MNLILFMLAGYETTSTTLSYCSYILAKYPEEQKKLFDEIRSFYGNNVRHFMCFYEFLLVLILTIIVF